MIRKEIVDVPRLFELKDEGFRNQTIALILNVSVETVRTILGGREFTGEREVQEEMRRLGRCA